MKALFLTNEYPPNIYGGAGIHIEYLTKELAKLIEVEVRCFGSQDLPEGSPKVKGYQSDLTRFAGCERKLRSPLSALDVSVAFNTDPIDAQLVHCHTWYSHFGGIIAKLGYGIPLIITTHSLEPLRPWKREQLGRGYDISSWVEKTTLEMADVLIAVSKGMKADILQLFDVPEDKIKVIYNGIDTNEYKPVDTKDGLIKYGVDPDTPYVLFFGRVTRQKGIIHLVNAIKYLDENIQVVLCAGQPDTEEIGREMEEKVQAIQAKRKNVVWIREWVSNSPKIELYSHATVFCCPSIYEPFGIINLEAMACATPVVGSAVGGIREIIDHGRTGFLVELEQQRESPFEAVNPDQFSRDLAESINKIVADENLQRAMGQASRKRAEELFSWQAIAQETLALYQTLV
ncbi:MAG TPA: glycogen synthase [Anaerolineae bacterium]|nr:glycogen synthase [Anaerolineae bacterium]HMR65764.1 glycogen synthase [Anaerolineae bacterium]